MIIRLLQEKIIYTAFHPTNALERFGLKNRDGSFDFCKTQTKPVIIGDNVQIGGGVIILPGVTIGNNVVIGAGSVVTKDIPDNKIAYGNPCKVVRDNEQVWSVYMKKIYKYLYIFSIVLVLFFIVMVGVDYFSYDLVNNSAPFYTFVLLRFIEFIVPSIIIFIIAEIIKKKYLH